KITTAIIGLIILFATLAIVALVENVFGVGLGITRNIYFTPIGVTQPQVKSCLDNAGYQLVPRPSGGSFATAAEHSNWACCTVDAGTGNISACRPSW
ncbi:MAG: hypothetical protein NUV65_06470, partial [Candidatus Roizmanbacteria bacterium]|nr:hypothetical protein [Candidatus Roizmanbacteria bacterium]